MEIFTIHKCFCSDTNGYPILASVPVHITAQKYDIPYQFIFQGDWDLINDKSYIDNLYEVLINSYPRAYQRWAFSGDEPLVLYVAAEANSEAIAYNAGTKVAVQVGYANSAPDDVGLFAHEFTHAIQSFFAIEYDNGWFTEAMADYGRFRFFHWGYNAKYAKIYSQDNKDIRDFRQHKDDPTSQWHQYASTNYFMAYLDLRWPTTDKNKDGKITPDEHGLIDHIVYEAKLLTKQGAKPVSDYPYTVGSTFNNWGSITDADKYIIDFCFFSKENVTVKSYEICDGKWGENNENLLSDHNPVRVNVDLSAVAFKYPDISGVGGVEDFDDADKDAKDY